MTYVVLYPKFSNKVINMLNLKLEIGQFDRILRSDRHDEVTVNFVYMWKQCICCLAGAVAGTVYSSVGCVFFSLDCLAEYAYVPGSCN